MLKIGEFSKLSRVSIRMLRHYDDIGLLEKLNQETRCVVQMFPDRYQQMSLFEQKE